MDDLDRVFQYLVGRLADTTPDRLLKPFQVSELYQRLVPYRTHKREMGFESIEDYEMAVLRLLAGERGYAVVDPPDAQQALADEVGQPNPNPGAFREFAAASVLLSREAVRQIVHHDAAYAPPQGGAGSVKNPVPDVASLSGMATRSPAAGEASLKEQSRPAAPIAPRLHVASEDVARATAPPEGRELVFEPVQASPTCPQCREQLPAGRTAVYCPHCGEQLRDAPCRSCGESIEPGWRYCLACGTPIHGHPTELG